MKILFANKFFFLNGGSERVFFQERAFLLKKGYDIIDFSMEDARNFSSSFSSFFVPNLDYHNTGGVWKKIKQGVSFVHSSVAVRNIEQLIKKEKPEISHLHNIYHQLTPSIIPVLQKLGVKVVLTLHDYKLVCPAYLALKGCEICTACAGRYFWKPFTTNCQSSRGKGLLLSIEAMWHKWQKSYDSVDLFLAPSRFMAELTAQRIPTSKIRILRNGIDINKYKPVFNDKGYILYFGRLSEEKGIEALLMAHKGLNEPLPLKVAGTGPLANTLQCKYPNATFLGYRSGQELIDLISKAAFIVVPSEWYENCPMVVLEAMALGKPVIASNIGGIPEQIDDGRTGFLFEVGNKEELLDKMQMLKDNSQLRLDMGHAARKKVKQEYSLDIHCQELLGIYDELRN